jgi:hypothetical protein
MATYKSEGLKISTYVNGTSPYLIQLDKYSATIGTNAEGEGYTSDTLKSVSTINVNVSEGNTDITSNCSFSWVVYGGILNSYIGSSVYFTNLTDDTAYAIVTVTKDEDILGTKQFTISKNK